MPKQWTQKFKKQLIKDAVMEAVQVLGLTNYQITIKHDNKAEHRATCEAEPHYLTAKLTFAPARIAIYECVEFGCHEPAHILTWPVAVMLERAAGTDPVAMEDATNAYEALTTQIGHIIFPIVVQRLEAAGKLPPEAKEIPTLLEEPNGKHRKAKAVEHVEVPIENREPLINQDEVVTIQG